MARVVKATVKLDITEAQKQAKLLGDTLSKAILKGVANAKNADRDFGALIKSIREAGKTSFNLSLEQKKLEAQVARTKIQLTNLQKAIEGANAAKAKAVQQSDLLSQKLKTEAERTKNIAALTVKRNQDTATSAERANTARLKGIRTLQNIEKANKEAAEAAKLFSAAQTKAALKSRLTQAGISLLFTALNRLKDEFVDSFKAAIAWESAFAGVGKTTEGVFEQLEDGTFKLTEFGRELEVSLLVLSRDIPIAVGELAKIGEAAGQLGVAAEDLELFTSTIAKLSVTTNLSSTVAATALAKLQTVLGITVEDTERVASAIVDLGNNTATTEKQIVTFAQRLSGAAAVVDLTAADLVGIAAAFESIGAQSQAASTAVQKTFLAMQQASIEGGDALELFAQVAGETPLVFSELFEADPGEAFTLFVEGLKRVGEEGGSATAILKKLELGDSRLIRSFLAIAEAGSLLRDDMELANEAFEANNALANEAALRFATTESAIQELKNAWQEWKIEAVETSWIKSITEGLTEFIQGLTDAERAAKGIDSAFQELADIGVRGTLTRVDKLGKPSDVRLDIPDDVRPTGVDTADLRRLNEQFQKELPVSRTKSETDEAELESLSFALLALQRDAETVDEQLDELAENAILSGEALTQSEIIEFKKDIELTGHELQLLAADFLESGQSIEEFFNTIDRVELIDALKTSFEGLTDAQAGVFADAITTEGFDLSLLDGQTKTAIANTRLLKGAFEDQTEVIRTNIAHQIRGSSAVTQSQEEALFATILARNGNIELAESVTGLSLAQVSASAEIRLFGEELVHTVDVTEQVSKGNETLQKALVETAVAFLDTSDAGEALIATALEEALALGLTDHELRGVIRSTGVFTEEQLLATETAGLLATAVERLTTQFITGQISPEQYAIRLGRLAEKSKEAAEETDNLTERTAELISQYIDGNTALGRFAEQVIEVGLESGVTSEQLLIMVTATGQLTRQQVKTIESTLKFEAAQRTLQNLLELGVITYGQYSAKLIEIADNLGLVTDATAEFTSALVTGLIKGDDALAGFTKRLIEAATEAGATSEQIIDLAIASGLLSDAQIETVRTSILLIEKERELLALVDGVGFTFAQAQQKLQQYAEWLGITADATANLSDVSRDLLGSISGNVGGGGGGGGVAEQSTPFRDDFLEVLSGVKGFGDEANDSISELVGTTEDWAEALFELSIEAGASIEQIIALGVATGKLSDEQAGQLLSIAAGKRGAEQIADAYVSGKISAEEAAGAIKSLSEQIQSGERIDLSQFGITAADLSANAKGLETSAGGSSRALKTWKDDLNQATQEAEANYQTMLRLTAVTSDYTDEQTRRGLVDDATRLAVENLGVAIAEGLDPAVGVANIEALRASLQELTTDDIALFLDQAIEAELDLSTDEAAGALEAFKDSGGTISVQASLDGITPDSIARTRAQIQEELNRSKDINAGAREAGLETDDNVITTTVIANVTKLKEAITGETTDKEYETTVADADVDGVEEAIHGVTTEAEYITTVEADIDISEIQRKLDAHEFVVDVTSNFGFGTSSSSNPAQPADGTNTPGGGVPEFAEGGKARGASHAAGGVDAELEGGGFVTKGSSVTPTTEPLLTAINNNGEAGLPAAIRDVLDRLTAPQVPLPPSLTSAGAVPSSPDPLSALVSPVQIPVPNNIDNSTSIDNRRTSTTSTVVNNYYGVGADNTRVSGSFDVSGKF